MKRPVIGISTSIIIDGGGMFPGYNRSYVNRDYVRSVLAASGVPLMLPMTDDREAIDQMLSLCDGLILSGGHDVCPMNYNSEPHRGLGEISPERDEFDIYLYSRAKELDLPLLGICRGFQINAASEGGSIYQDLGEFPGNALKHSQGHTPSMPSHHITIEKGSKLEKIVGKDRITVNSFHHQIVADAGEAMNVVAKADDGAIEAIEHKTARFVLGVQWHPEMMHASNPYALALFKALVNEAAKN